MAVITAQMVKELRELTGAGFMDCKKALNATGEIKEAVKFLREKGLSKAAKKADRVAAEGVIALCINEDSASMLELNCETDFVARNAGFRTLADVLCSNVTKSANLDNDVVLPSEALLDSSFEDGKKVVDVINENISTMGENITLRRALKTQNGNAMGAYVHGGGSIGVLVGLTVEDATKAKSPEVKAIARDIAMHVAAADPKCLDKSGADQSTVAEEEVLLKKQALAEGKPEAIVEKIVKGKLEKYLKEICLVSQKFVKDPDLSVEKWLLTKEKELGCKIGINAFWRFKVGEGIEKKTGDLASEVAEMIK